MRWLDGHNGHESEQTLGDSEGQGSLVCVLQSTGSQKVRQDSATGQLRHTKYLAFSLDSQEPTPRGLCRSVLNITTHYSCTGAGLELLGEVC